MLQGARDYSWAPFSSPLPPSSFLSATYDSIRTQSPIWKRQRILIVGKLEHTYSYETGLRRCNDPRTIKIRRRFKHLEMNDFREESGFIDSPRHPSGIRPPRVRDATATPFATAAVSRSGSTHCCEPFPSLPFPLPFTLPPAPLLLLANPSILLLVGDPFVCGAGVSCSRRFIMRIMRGSRSRGAPWYSG